MKVTQEKLPASQIGLEIEIPPEESKQTYEQVIQKFTRAANIPGFRKGKVPRQILLQRLGTMQIKAAAIEELIQKSVKEALEQVEVAAIGQPELRSSFDDLISQYEPGKSLTILAAIDVAPEVDLKQYTGLQIKAEQVEYDPASVDKMLADERSQMATLIPVEGRAAQLGDIAVVDFKGFLALEAGSASEQEIPGASGTDFQVELQQDRFIPGFVDGIVGMNPGETKEVSAQFPEDYPQEDISGKPAVFTITLKELKEKELPELNDDFAQEVSEYESLAELRAALEKRFQTEAERKTKANQEKALTDELVKYLEVDLPETMITQEVSEMLTQTAVQLSQQGIDVKKLFTQDTIGKLRENSRPDAIERLKRSLALQEIAKRESITVEPAQIAARVQELTAEYGDEKIDKDRLQEVVADELLREKIIDWLIEHSSIEMVAAGTLNLEPEATTSAASEDTADITPSTASAAVVGETTNPDEVITDATDGE